MSQCPSCGAGYQGPAHFCGVCGQRLDPPAAASPPSTRDMAPAVEALGSLFDAGGDPYLGKTLNNRFLVQSKLGEGGFGAVYRGLQQGTDRAVALKLLHPEMTRDKTVVERFRREGRVLCSLKDAHTVTTYDFDQTPDGTLFIAMELLEGRSLHDVLRDEAPIRWQRMIKFLSEMCSSLHEAHEMGIVHRDLKPENVHLEVRPGNDEFVKILDFGIAKMLRGDGFGGKNAQLTATGQTLGTLEYMSPEQLMGKELDGRSDIYGMGVLAYELMTGRLPFPDAVGPAPLISAQLKRIPDAPSTAYPQGGIPRAVDGLILRMLEKDRANRFEHVIALRDECLRILVEDSGTSQPGVPMPSAPLMSAAPSAYAPIATPHLGPGAARPALQPLASSADREPGPATRAIIEATAPRKTWLVVAIVSVLVIGTAIAAVIAMR